MPAFPLAFWMLLAAILLALWNDSDAKTLISTFNSGWGYAAGEFALILIPAFVLAECVNRLKGSSPPLISVLLSPMLGANMICPDTAHASLSPMAKRAQLKVGLGAYAGFKLLFPAGPLIVATSLGGMDGDLMLFGVMVFIPVWLVGLGWAHLLEERIADEEPDKVALGESGSIWLKILPFAVLLGLVFIGFIFEFNKTPTMDFVTDPKGALLVSSLVALGMVRDEDRVQVVEGGLRRAASILLIIGLASALSAFLAQMFAMDRLFGDTDGVGAILALFCLTALVKLLQGSSMATFAAVGPLALPLVETSGLPPNFAVLAICLGSFIAILPNDSYYWLLRDTAFDGARSNDTRVIAILGGGACLQATIGLLALLAIYIIFH